MEPAPKRKCCENMICSNCFHHNCNAECYKCSYCIMMEPVPTPVVQEPEAVTEAEAEVVAVADADADAESDVDFDDENFLFEICGTCCKVNGKCDCL
jgi:hypothetical protein